MLDLSRLDPAPKGFGRCGKCTYRDGGSASICFACASQRLDAVSPNRCLVCDQALGSSTQCSNYWCNRSDNDRQFRFIYAIAMHSGSLQTAIDRYKTPRTFEEAKWGWGIIFGRVLVGYLDDHKNWFKDFDLIVANPTFVDPSGRRAWDHVGYIMENAALEAGDRWPFDAAEPRTIIKVAETESMRGKSLYDRRRIAEQQVRGALVVPSEQAVAGRSILVFDDVFTEGSTLHEVARALRAAGAREVAGIVLARQPWSY